MAEHLKTALITLLSLTLVGLLFAFFAVSAVSEALSAEDIIFEFFRHDQKTQTTHKNVEETAISTPCQIALFKGNGKLYSPTSSEDFYNIYKLTSRITDEALGSARAMTEMSNGDYLPLFINMGVLYKYDFALPVALIFPEMADRFLRLDFSVKTLLVSLEGRNVLLVLTDENGKHYSFSTMSDPTYLQGICSEYEENGIISAITSISDIAHDSILINEAFSMPVYTTANYGEAPEGVMSTLGMNPYLTSVYRDGENTIYMEDIHRVIMQSNGHLSYSATEKDDGIPLNIDIKAEEKEQYYALCLGSSAIVSALWQELSDDNVSLCYSFSKQTEDGYIFYYEAYIGGCYVYAKDHSAAAVAVSNGKITDISLHPLRLNKGEDVQLIPYKQAAATAGKGEYIAIQYELTEGVLTPVTVCVKEESR